jgi:hypothetical protein
MSSSSVIAINNIHANIYENYTSCSRLLLVPEEIPHGSTVHFTTVDECINFVHYLSTRNIHIIDFCCNGRGCKLFRICNKNSELLKSDYCARLSTIQNHSLPSQPVQPNHTCDICYESTNTLYTRCMDVRHNGCLSCWSRLSSNSCPFCRSELRDIMAL